MGNKVIVTQVVADIIEQVKGEYTGESHDWIAYKVFGRISTHYIDELEEGTITVAKAIVLGYEVKKEIQFMNFGQAVVEMAKGRKVNCISEREHNKGKKRFHKPLFLHEGKIHYNEYPVQWIDTSDYTSTKWYVVE